MFYSLFWASFSHSSCTPHASYPYSYLLFFPSLLIHLSIHDKKGGEYTREYTGVYRHFYMTHEHILRGSYSISCTFVGVESHRGDVYTKGEKSFLFKKILLCLFSCFALWCIELCLVSMLCCSHCIVFMCWTCIHPYAIVLCSFHVRMIIWFAIWSLQSFLYDCHVFDQVAHICHIMFTWSHFTCYIILVFLLLALPWGSNAFCASGSGYRYICSKFITGFRFRCEWVSPLLPNSRLSLESVIRCFCHGIKGEIVKLWFTTMFFVAFIPWQKVL